MKDSLPARETSPDDFLLTSEVAKLAAVTPALVRYWANTKRLPHFRTPGGLRLFRRADVVHHLVDRRERGPAAGRRRG